MFVPNNQHEKPWNFSGVFHADYFTSALRFNHFLTPFPEFDKFMISGMFIFVWFNDFKTIFCIKLLLRQQH